MALADFDIESFKRDVIQAHERLEIWLKQKVSNPVTLAHICEVTEEITISLEELTVALTEIFNKQAELEATRFIVQEERQRYLDLFEYAPDGYIVTNNLGIIQKANQAAAEMLNRRQNFLIGKPFYLFIYPSDRKNFYELLNSLQLEESIYRGEICIKPSYDLPRFDAAISITPIKNIQYAGVGFRWLLRDISHFKKAQAESKRQQEIGRLTAVISREIRQFCQLETILLTIVTESQKLLQIERVVIFRLESDNTVSAIAEAGSEDKSCFLGQNFNCEFLPNNHLPKSEKLNKFEVCQVIPEYYFQTTNNPNQLKARLPKSEVINLVAPIYVREKLWGFLAFHRYPISNAQIPKPQWQDFEIEVCKHLADQIGIAATLDGEGRSHFS